MVVGDLYNLRNCGSYCRSIKLEGFMSDQSIGKTTRMFDFVVAKLGELPEDTIVMISGAHINWLHTLERDFRSAGLTSVAFFTPDQIIQGRHRGIKGILVIDDFFDLPPEKQEFLLFEKNRLDVIYGGE